MSSEIALDTRCRLGEGPLWDPSADRLYWVDILSGTLHRYDPRVGEHDIVLDVDTITGITLQEDGSLLTFHEHGEIGRFADGELTHQEVLVPHAGATRFNDVIADAAGRVFCGTMPTDERGGDLFRIDPDRSVHRIETGLAIPNGMGFTADRETFYFTESEGHTVYAYDYEHSTGEVSNRRELIATEKGEGVPDGLTVDASGHLWSARYGGGCVVQYEANGTEKERYPLNCERPTSVCFGGEDRSQLFVTTAGGEDRSRFGPNSGRLLTLDVDAIGRTDYRSSIQW